MMLGLWYQPRAHATCESEYGAAALGKDMAALSAAMRKKDKSGMADAGARLAQGLPCTKDVLPRPALASAYRWIGVHYATGGVKVQAGRYFRSALELDPSFEWGLNDLALGDPIRVLFEAERPKAQGEPVSLEGKAFAPPAGTQVYIDGRLAKEVKATLDRPHLVQVVAGNKASATHLINGVEFPEGLISDAAMVTTRKDGGGGPLRVERLRPPAKTPLLILGGTGVVAGAGLYAASFAARSTFNSATTTEEVTTAQGTTNALVIASGVSLLLGVGTGYAGFLLDGGPGLVYHLRY